MSESVFHVGSQAGSMEILEKTIKLEGVTVYARTRAPEVGFAGTFERLPVWVSRDVADEGAPAGWVGIDAVPNEGGGVTVVGNVFLINAARLDSETGIARVLQSLVQHHCVSFEEAKRATSAAADAVGIAEAEAEVFGGLLREAAGEVRHAAEAVKQKALSAARATLALSMAPAADPTTE